MKVFFVLFLVCLPLHAIAKGPTRLELLRAPVVASQPQQTRTIYPWEGHVVTWATHFRLEPSLVMALIHAESYYNPRAVSSVGARGLMQLKPKTGADYGVGKDELFVPERNIHAGCAHLRWLLDHYRGDITRALAAYNYGHRRVSKDRGFVKKASVRKYVRKIMRARKVWQSRQLTPNTPMNEHHP